jgi:hypothetical protein
MRSCFYHLCAADTIEKLVINLCVLLFYCRRIARTHISHYITNLFVAKWSYFRNVLAINFKGPALALLAEQSSEADEWLESFREFVEKNKEYRDRLAQPYRLVKNLVRFH